MKTSVIIPVKTFSHAKRRLNLPQQQKEEICKLMFEEVLKTISGCKLVDKTFIVSKDESALKLGKTFGAVPIFDDETGVNHAVFLADQHIPDNEYDCSIIFPQDIPLMKSTDIYDLLGFLRSERSVIVVPSRQFNGTNALLRCPAKIMNTQYDMGSYSHQLNAARAETQNISVALIRGIMLDIDDESDLTFMLNQSEKHDFCKKIRNF